MRRFWWARGGRPFTVSLWHWFRPPPWGGGNQFMLALREALAELGVRVSDNGAPGRADAHILQAIWFDVAAFRRRIARRDAPVIHRIDGIMSMYRADSSGAEQDELCFALNREFATATVVQSRWVLDRILERGFQPVSPAVIPNAASPRFFYPGPRRSLSAGRKVRLISVSWSPNPNKGAPFYRSLEPRLDWNRYEYTFVGNSPVRFERIRQLGPVGSEELGRLLREHDVFITASRKEACSNAVVEALCCGLPVLYIDDGSHAELVQEGGLAFAGLDDFFGQLEALVADYERFRSRIAPPRIQDVARRYLSLAGYEPAEATTG